MYPVPGTSLCSYRRTKCKVSATLLQLPCNSKPMLGEESKKWGWMAGREIHTDYNISQNHSYCTVSNHSFFFKSVSGSHCRRLSSRMVGVRSIGWINQTTIEVLLSQTSHLPCSPRPGRNVSQELVTSCCNLAELRDCNISEEGNTGSLCFGGLSLDDERETHIRQLTGVNALCDSLGDFLLVWVFTCLQVDFHI